MGIYTEEGGPRRRSNTKGTARVWAQTRMDRHVRSKIPAREAEDGRKCTRTDACLMAIEEAAKELPRTSNEGSRAITSHGCQIKRKRLEVQVEDQAKDRKIAGHVIGLRSGHVSCWEYHKRFKRYMRQASATYAAHLEREDLGRMQSGKGDIKSPAFSGTEKKPG
ncbi:hypothetical protein AOQ84DRAFT_422528 [Glonium stellatum]|uniref:Uncharacterized protein n=1 Tax=Glonium stellatum TaxID=574774 RepID=A0A8E2JWG2_9PEZI|nr:hypothetical protein AOQ84DRAFT_422528 [Glonium stellatum]